MPSIKDKSTVEAIAQEFCSNGRNKEQTLKTMGYAKGYAESRGHTTVFGNVRVKDAISRIDAETKEKLQHNRDKAIKLLTESLVALESAISKGNIAAINARTAVIRELDAISNLHSSTLHTDDKQDIELSESQKAEAQRIANIRLAEIA